MAELILLPSLEFLKPYSDTTKSVFGMTFSVAMNQPRTLSELGAWEGLGESFLQPWTWDSEKNSFLEIEALRFLDPADLARVHDHKIDKREKIDALNAALIERFKLFADLEKEDLSPWSWTAEKTSISKRERPWPAFTGELSLYPRPLPQAMRLSFQAEIPADFWTGSLVVAPILRLKLEGDPIELFPSLQASTAEDRVTLIYNPADPALLTIANPLAPPFPSLRAETMVRKKVDLTSAYFDFGDLWVRGKKDDMTASNWRAGLEERLAGHLQLGAPIVDSMKEQLTMAAAESDSAKRAKILDALAGVYVEMTRKALFELRTATVPYLENGFPGGHLLGRLAPLWRDEAAKEFEAATARGLAEKATDWFKNAASEASLDDWIEWVSPKVEGVQRSRILGAATSKGPGLASLPMEDAIAELDQLAAHLFTPAVLGTVFKNVWGEFLKKERNTLNDAEKELAEAFATRSPIVETDFGLQLLKANVGRHWKELASAFRDEKAAKSQSELAKGLQKVLENLGLAAAWAKKKSEEMAASVIPLSVTDSSRPLSLGQQGITVQVDTIKQDQDPNSQDGDLLRHMQGVGLLMRKTGTTAWRCLNLGAACIGPRVIAEPVLLPSRIAYLNDLRDPTVIYDNAPLTVRGPLSTRRVSGTQLEGEQDLTRKEIDEPLVEFIHAGSDWKIPGLVFGHNYDTLPFLVTNSGALPVDLVKAEKAGWGKVDGIKGIENVHIRKGYEYRRTVHVGALRFRPVNADGLPQIPANVAPRVRELSVTDVLADGDPLRQKSGGALEGMPLLLLAPESFPFRSGFKLPNQFGFEISPPTADLETWDRWVALNGEKERRKFVWRSFYELNLNKKGDKIPLDESGIYLDDPAITALWAELASLSGPSRQQTGDILLDDGHKKSPKPDLSNWKKIPVDLGSEQSLPLKVACKVDSTGGITVTLSRFDTTSKVNEVLASLTGTGGIYRLSFYAVLGNGAEKRFAWPAGKTESVRDAPKAGTSAGTSPWHLLIEVPKELPAEKEKKEELQDKLHEAIKPDGKGAETGTLAVKLDMNDPVLKDLNGLVYRAELQHQVWGWRGRPPAPHPDLGPAIADERKKKEEILKFEMSEFGERSDDEHRLLPLPRQVTKLREPEFLYRENLNERGPQGDPRALHNRFSARVFSRWEGILRDEDSFLEAMEKGTENRWKPLFVPCRHIGEVPVPKVKMVLPLTQGSSDSVSDGPGLMVVMDGPWYEVGGLSEKLVVEVMKVTGPEADPSQDKPDPEYFQIGTDPIVTSQSAGKLLGTSGALSTKGNLVEFETIAGAIGHHRDHSQTNPRFLASSFLLSRPTLTVGGEKKAVDISWWFLKLRFKRTLGAGKGESGWSAPFWVQVLPGVERVEEDWFKSGSPGIWVDDNDPKRLWVNQALPAPDPNSRFYLFGVMTRKVIDFAGRPDQEAYVGVWVPDGNSWKIDTTIGDRKDLFIRWIEVQSSQKPDLTKGEELWDRLFKAGLEDSKRMRIVRISKRFDVKPGRFS
jgi:hypothetical protein